MFIYIHLPFCRSRCIYCDFVVALKGQPKQRQRYMDALVKEIQFYWDKANELMPIQGLYLGGGTPSLFTADELGQLLNTLTSYTPLAAQAEVTMEANPESVADPFEAYRAIGINRLSVGVQSFQPNELKRLSRIHTPEKAKATLKEANNAGFSNISLDLMYGIPEQTQASWHDTLMQAVALKPTHISAYGLQVESNTPLERLIDQGRLSSPPDEQTVTMYRAACDMLAEVGYHRYEFSNWAKPGYESRHNLNYWRPHGQWWAFGVGAHGLIKDVRYENTDQLESYLAHSTERADEYRVMPKEHQENALIFGLRLTQGVDIQAWEKAFALSFTQTYGTAIQPWLNQGYLRWEGTRLILTDAAIPVSNEVLQSFLMEPTLTLGN